MIPINEPRGQHRRGRPDRRSRAMRLTTSSPSPTPSPTPSTVCRHRGGDVAGSGGSGQLRGPCRPCSRAASTWWSVRPILLRLAVVVWLWMQRRSHAVALLSTRRGFFRKPLSDASSLLPLPRAGLCLALATCTLLVLVVCFVFLTDSPCPSGLPPRADAAAPHAPVFSVPRRRSMSVADPDDTKLSQPWCNINHLPL